MDPATEDKHRAEKLSAEFLAHPQLIGPVEALLAKLEGETALGSSADEIEERVITQIRALGQASLQRWAEQASATARPAGQAAGQAHRHSKKTLVDEHAGPQVARPAGWAAGAFLHGIGDGAEWIAEQFRQHFAAHGRYTLDLYHVCDYLSAWPPEPAQAASFVSDAREQLRHNQSEQVIAALAARLEAPEIADEQAPVRRAHRYLSNRREQLDYQSAITRELPVGSGLIESGHRHVLQARLKLPGAWWKPHNAHAMAPLRVCRANGRWHTLGRNQAPSLSTASFPERGFVEGRPRFA